jgi:hypothetical protein
MQDRTPSQAIAAPLAGRPELDRLVAPMEEVAARLLADPARAKLLKGSWLGHPVHPALTDLPIGFWTSAFVLDLAGGRNRRAADLMVGLGLLSALPTIAAGLADWAERDHEDKRIGAVHATANASAFLLYALSLGHRARGHRGRGVLLGFAGAAAATIGGLLGGHLAYGSTPDEATEVDQQGAEQVVDQQGAALRAVAGAPA